MTNPILQEFTTQEERDDLRYNVLRLCLGLEIFEQIEAKMEKMSMNLTDLAYHTEIPLKRLKFIFKNNQRARIEEISQLFYTLRLDPSLTVKTAI